MHKKLQFHLHEIRFFEKRNGVDVFCFFFIIDGHLNGLKPSASGWYIHETPN